MDNLAGEKDDPDAFLAVDATSKDERRTIDCTENANCEPDSGNKEIEIEITDVNTNINEYKPMAIKKKHRRGSRRSKGRKYKPYSKLTWEEKKAVEERDSRRAVSIREKYMHEKGRPLAPFNTSQFLMAEHDTQEPDLHVSHHHHSESHSRLTRLSSSADDSDDAGSSLSDEERDIEDVRNFLQKDFTETYERLHSESLHQMNKDELVNEYMQLEDKVENLEKELTTIKSNGKVNGLYPSSDMPEVVSQVNNVNSDHCSEDASRQKLELEVEKLREENRQLHIENSILRPQLTTKETSSVWRVFKAKIIDSEWTNELKKSGIEFEIDPHL